MKKLILIFLLSAGSLFSQNIIYNNGFNVDTIPIKATNGIDTIKIFLSYNVATTDYFIGLYDVNYDFTDNEVFAFLNFQEYDPLMVVGMQTRSSLIINTSINNLYKFLDKLISIEFNTKTENIKFHILDIGKSYLFRLVSLAGYKR